MRAFEKNAQLLDWIVFVSHFQVANWINYPNIARIYAKKQNMFGAMMKFGFFFFLLSVDCSEKHLEKITDFILDLSEEI